MAAAAFCGVAILVINFFMGLTLTMPEGFGGFARAAVTTQIVVIALPALLMAFFLTRSPRQTLLLKWPRWPTLPAAALLAVALHPAAKVLQAAVQNLYTINDNVRPALVKMQELFQSTDFWPLVLVMALIPALCEELAFRGFILSGFRHLGHKWQAIILSAVLFGITHCVLQQSLIACVMGTVLGFLAVQSGSIMPGVVFHAVHNALAVANGRISSETIAGVPLLRGFVTPNDGSGGGCDFEWPLVVVATLSAVLLLMWFGRLNSPKSQEEVLEESIERGEQERMPLVPT